MELYVVRQPRDHRGQVGTVIVPKPFFHATTLEQPWNDDEPFHSCVPAARYLLVPHNSPKHPNTFALVAPQVGVFHSEEDAKGYTGKYPVRTECLFMHPADEVEQLEGCVSSGVYHEHPDGTPCLLGGSSIPAVNAVLKALHDAPGPHYVTILDAPAATEEDPS